MEKIKCSFCAKTRKEVDQMIAGPQFENKTIYICDECVDFSHNVIHADEETTEIADISFTPSDIKKKLDMYVVGQDPAKLALSVAVYNHYKRVYNSSSVVLDKSNVMMIGPSGTGKTLLVKTVADSFDVPCVIADATTLTESGYVGTDVDQIIEILLERADNDIEKAQRGIIFIDEIDKIARKGKSSVLGRDVSGEGVQQALLKLIEGTILKVTRPDGNIVDFDTSDVLFVVSGAFIGLDKIVDKNNMATSIGFNASVVRNTPEILNVSCEDLIEYGIIPEFIGRVPVVVELSELTEDMLVQIMTEPKNSLVEQFTQLFKIDGVQLVFDDKYIHQLARDSLQRKIGARGLRSLMEKTLEEVQFNLPDLAKAGVRKVAVNSQGIIKYTYRRKKTQVNSNEKKR